MKHSKHIICFPFCLIILIMFVACTKEGHHYSISQEFKDYFLFQKGSYWIYQNDSTNSIDCTYLATQPSFEIYKTGDHQKSDPSIEQYLLPFTSGIFKGFEIFTKTDSHNYLLFYINSEPDAFGMIDQLIPDSNYYFESRPQGYFKVWPFIPSFDVNAITFYQVLNSRFNNTKEENTFNFYFAKHFGLIKLFGKWENKNQSWSLIRYHIVQ
jgi:hypothetical protein